MRQLSRGGRRKNDRIDAAAAACVTALQGDAYPVRAEDSTDSLALLDERRVNLSRSRTRTINQLHALLRELLAGGASTSLTPAKATAALRGYRAKTPTDTVRVALCRDLIADLRRFDEQLAANARLAAQLLDDCGTTLREIDGVGDVLAARVLGRTGPATRFGSAGAYANYAGTAQVQVASAEDNPPPTLPLRRPGTQLRDLHHRHHPSPYAQQSRPRLLRQEDRRRQDTPRRDPLPQAPAHRPPLTNDDHRRRPSTTQLTRTRARLLTDREAPTKPPVQPTRPHVAVR